MADATTGDAAATCVPFIDKIPTEIRNSIYELVLVEQIPGRHEMMCPHDLGSISVGFHTSVPALLQVSRQVRAETSPIYYGSNSFYVEYGFDDYRGPVEHACEIKLLAWLAKLGPESRALIRRVYVDEGHHHPDDIGEAVRAFREYVEAKGAGLEGAEIFMEFWPDEPDWWAESWASS